MDSKEFQKYATKHIGINSNVLSQYASTFVSLTPNIIEERPMNVAVMGCVVNGPGESRHADIGISLPGTGEVPSAPVYVDGERTITLKGDTIAQEFQAIVEQYVERRYGVDSNNNKAGG